MTWAQNRTDRRTLLGLQRIHYQASERRPDRPRDVRSASWLGRLSELLLGKTVWRW